MRSFVVWLMLGTLLVHVPVRAQQHIADPAVMQRAISDYQANDDATRRLVKRVLDRSDVQAVARQMGLDVKQAKAAVDRMPHEQLAALADPARAIDADLAGGASTITISITTLLLVIIVVLLIVLIAD
jgi:hypothetical protein